MNCINRGGFKSEGCLHTATHFFRLKSPESSDRGLVWRYCEPCTKTRRVNFNINMIEMSHDEAIVYQIMED